MTDKIQLSPPSYVDQTWFNQLYARVGEGPFLIKSYDVANLPTASEWGSITSGSAFTSIIFVRDETGGAIPAFSDGTNWRRCSDRSIVA